MILSLRFYISPIFLSYLCINYNSEKLVFKKKKHLKIELKPYI